MPTPYPFQSGATLLASQMNSLSQLPTVSITSNSTAVATHAYSRIVANGSAITYTIPNSVFEAGQVIEFHNINSTACTIAAGAGVTLNGAAGLTVAQYQAATIYATSASSFILFESAVTQTTAGLELVKSQTIGNAVSSVTVTDAFSATYDNYKIIYFGGSASATPNLDMILGSTTTGYSYTAYYQIYNASTLVGEAASNASNWLRVATARPNGAGAVIELFRPFLATRTTAHWTHACNATAGDGLVGRGQGFLDNATSYTAFTLTPNSGTITGGTINVYGYRN